MVAFLAVVPSPPDRVTAPDQFVQTPAEQHGRDLFFGRARCFGCHGGPTFAEAFGGGNLAFGTGVVRLPVHSLPPGCVPPCPPLAGGGAHRRHRPALSDFELSALRCSVLGGAR